METDPSHIRSLVQNAREALRRGDMAEARGWAEHVARLAPELEEGWLLLAAVSAPAESLQHARRAWKINPRSTRAQKAMEWARKRAGLEGTPAEDETPAPRKTARTGDDAPNLAPRRRWLTPVLLVAIVCLAAAFAAWSARKSSALTSLAQSADAPPPTATLESHFASLEISKPTYTPEWTFTPSRTPTLTVTPTLAFTSTPLSTDTPLPTDTSLPTDTPGAMEISILVDTPTSIPPTAAPYVAPTKQASAPPASGGSGGAHWIDINLSAQMLYAYEGDTLVNSFVVSTGVAATPTVTGSYKIYARYLYADMHGPGYFLPDVPYVMYFHKSYGIHGTYWHNNFGTPMSHGCVNLSISDAAWVYNWSAFGTTVKVHY